MISTALDPSIPTGNNGLGAIGVAGCGAMGLPMAKRLLASGFDAWGFDVNKIDVKDAFSVRMIENPREFAEKCDVVLSVVRDQTQTMALFFDDQALFSVDKPPRTVVICSTVSPLFVNIFDDMKPNTTTLLDAPMSGAPYRAENGTLSFMVGGADPDVTRLTPLFQAMGSYIHHMGGVGTGMACKVVNNFVGLSGVVAVRKALHSAKAMGLDRRRLLDVMRVSSGATWYGDNLDDISWAREGYDLGNTIGILEKDLLSYLDAAPRGMEDLEEALLDELRRMEALDDF